MFHYEKGIYYQKIKLQNIAVLIEFLTGAGLAIFSTGASVSGSCLYHICIGILLSLVTYLWREDIEKTREELLEPVSPCP